MTAFLGELAAPACVQGDDPTAAVTYASFETKLLEIMASRAWDPDPPEVLLRVNMLHASIKTPFLGWRSLVDVRRAAGLNVGVIDRCTYT